MNDRTKDSVPDTLEIFISYNSRDFEEVCVVREYLQSRGVSSFLDRKHLV